jgi:hypothetical protein
MLTSGFKHAPVSQILVIGIVATSIIASITDTKYYFYIQIVPHIWNWRQFWRLLTWQVSGIQELGGICGRGYNGNG